MKSQRLLFAALLLIMLSSGFLLYKQFNKSEYATGPSVGEVLNTAGDTRRKTKGSFSFGNIGDSSAVYSKDTLFTGARSKMAVSLIDGSVIKMNQNSLVVINIEGKRNSVKLGLGLFEIEVPDTSSLNIFRRNDSKIKISKGSKLKILQGQDQQFIQIASGSVTVSDKEGQKKKIGSGQTIKKDLKTETWKEITQTEAQENFKVHIKSQKELEKQVLADLKSFEEAAAMEAEDKKWQELDEETADVKVNIQDQKALKAKILKELEGFDEIDSLEVSDKQWKKIGEDFENIENLKISIQDQKALKEKVLQQLNGLDEVEGTEVSDKKWQKIGDDLENINKMEISIQDQKLLKEKVLQQLKGLDEVEGTEVSDKKWQKIGDELENINKMGVSIQDQNRLKEKVLKELAGFDAVDATETEDKSWQQANEPEEKMKVDIKSQKDLKEQALKDLAAFEKEESVESKEKPLTAPKVKSDNNRYTIPNKRYPKGLYRAPGKSVFAWLFKKSMYKPAVKWLKEPDAKHYEVQVDGQRIEKLKYSSYRVDNFKLNQPRQVRFRTHYQNDKKGPWSKPETFEVQMEPPTSLVPDLHKDIANGPKGNVRLKWRPTLLTSFYELELASLDDENQKKRYVTPKNVAFFGLFYNKDYQWRVRSLDKNKKPLTPFSPFQDAKVIPDNIRKLSSVEDKKAEMETKVNLDDVYQKTDSLNQVWFGGGMNFINADGAVIAVGGANWLLIEKWGAEVQFNYNEGGLTPDSNVTVVASEDSMMGFSGEAFKIMKNRSFMGLPIRPRLRFGLRLQDAPLISRRTETNYQVVGSQLTMASIGYSVDVPLKSRFFLEHQLNYLYPLAADGFDISGLMNFDIVFGASYAFNSNWFSGLYWRATYQDYEFTETNNTSGFPFDGNYQFFQSNIDVRLGYEF